MDSTSWSMERGRLAINEAVELRVVQWFCRRRVKVMLLIQSR